MDDLIPQSRFNNFVLDDCKKPSNPEMYNFFSIMEGCEKYKIDTQWIKNMLNWDLYTHLEYEIFLLSTPNHEKVRLSQEWTAYMEKTNIWLSFYE